MDKYLTITEVSEILGVSRPRSRQLLRDAEVPLYVLSPRRTRVKEQDLEDWLESKRR